MSRTELARIHALTFHRDELTKARRSAPIPQLSCRGSPCRLFQPEVVRCTNIGGHGTDVDWKCEADLPSSLRFGKVDVSCEGWEGPGDPYVLKGSCGLQYRLVQIDESLRDNEKPLFPERSDWLTKLFHLVWFAILGFILYTFLKSCMRGRRTSNNTSGRTTGQQRPNSGFNFPGGGGFFGGGSGSYDPPPPYYDGSKDNSGSTWRPGFWSGVALGGLGASMMNNRDRNRQYDWERDRARAQSSWFGGSSSHSSSNSRRYDDRGEGPSNLGSMRSATAYSSGTNVR